MLRLLTYAEAAKEGLLGLEPADAESNDYAYALLGTRKEVRDAVRVQKNIKMFVTVDGQEREVYQRTVELFEDEAIEECTEVYDESAKNYSILIG